MHPFLLTMRYHPNESEKADLHVRTVLARTAYHTGALEYVTRSGVSLGEDLRAVFVAREIQCKIPDFGWGLLHTRYHFRDK